MAHHILSSPLPRKDCRPSLPVAAPAPVAPVAPAMVGRFSVDRASASEQYPDIVDQGSDHPLD